MISIITPARIKDAQGARWLHECIASVRAQSGDFEHIIVNDHSPHDLAALRDRWPHVRWLDAEDKGVSAARNQAAEAAKGELLLPLDADDMLSDGALASFREAWANRGKAGIIYSDVVMFGEDYARVYMAAEYDFRTLLKATFMTVGCLHQKADWERAGGWRVDMTQGLEDWEYWITLGEMGVCGKRIAAPLYWYRRHPRGRLQWLKANHELWDRAYVAMRNLHKDSFNGRYPMGCCGGAKRAPRRAAPARRTARPVPAQASEKTGDGLVLLVYYGRRKGGFRVSGGVTRTRYHVPGQGKMVQIDGTAQQGVKPADVPWFRSVNGGQDFRPVQVAQAQPPAPPTASQPAAQALAPAEVDLEQWRPDVMEDEPDPLPDLQVLTVAEIRDLDIDPARVDALLVQEREGKDRVTVIEHLEGLR